MLHTETVVTFSEAGRKLPRLNGKPISPSTIWRWARHGVRGVQLETRLLGGRFVTSVEALDRFSKALADADPQSRREVPPPVTARRRSAKQREKDIARAEAELKAAGCR